MIMINDRNDPKVYAIFHCECSGNCTAFEYQNFFHNFVYVHWRISVRFQQ